MQAGHITRHNLNSTTGALNPAQGLQLLSVSVEQLLPRQACRWVPPGQLNIDMAARSWVLPGGDNSCTES